MCFQLASTKEFALYIPFLLTTLNQVYLLCYYGQKLNDLNLKVSDHIFQLNWYEIDDSEVMKMVPFMIQQSQKPNTLQAQGFSVIKLNTFMGVSH